MELEIELIQSKWINIDQISPNEGQIDDVPCNPRTITPAEYESLKRSILDFPKMLALKELYVKPFEDGYVVVDGNMRLKAMNELGITKAPCKIVPSDYTPEEIMQLIVTANLPFGDWDTSRLQEDAWDKSKLADWFGEKMPEFDIPNEESSGSEGTYDGGKDSNYHIVYELVFSDEAEQERWYKFISALRSKYPDAETISERVLYVVSEWMNNQDQEVSDEEGIY